MKKTSRRTFGKLMAGADAAIPASAVAQSPREISTDTATGEITPGYSSPREYAARHIHK